MTKKSNEGVNYKKEEDFSKWYTEVVQKADLADYTSVSGCIVFKPSVYSIWEKITAETDKKFKKTGIKNSYFPLFIPEKLLSKEKEHVKGFSPEVAWVTEAGNSKLAERLAIRPTSETIMYASFSKWIKSWKDLPLKLNQWNNVVRWEFKHPVPFLRTREFLWNEGHTVFATKEEAESERNEIIGIYKHIVEDYMGLYGLIGKKSDKEKFAGAEYTISMEYLLPNGKAVQGPDFHHDGQNFAKAFDIKFLDKNEKKQYAWQNTFAISTRMLGIMIAVHSDNKGFVLPPRLAENQVVIIPIFKKEDKEKIIRKAKKISSELKKYNPIIDHREEYSPGWKFNEWELKGIPIRIELGPRDLKNKEVVLVRRDNGEKKNIKFTNLKKEIEKTLESIQADLLNRSKENLERNIKEVGSIQELKKVVSGKKIAFAPFCNDPKCEEDIKYQTNGAKTLNAPLNQSRINKKCIGCGKEAREMFYFGKSY